MSEHLSDRPGPGLARCAALTLEQLSNLDAKDKFEELIAAAGLDGEQQGRELARILGFGESTVRGWRNRKALDRRPRPEALETLREYVQFRALTLRFGAM